MQKATLLGYIKLYFFYDLSTKCNITSFLHSLKKIIKGRVDVDHYQLVDHCQKKINKSG